MVFVQIPTHVSHLFATFDLTRLAASISPPVGRLRRVLRAARLTATVALCASDVGALVNTLVYTRKPNSGFRCFLDEEPVSSGTKKPTLSYSTDSGGGAGNGNRSLLRETN